MIEKEVFWLIYKPALRQALSEDKNNFGFYVKGPDEFIPIDLIPDIEIYIERDKENESFFNLVEYYFDALSHGFTTIDGIMINEIKHKLLTYIVDR